MRVVFGSPTVGQNVGLLYGLMFIAAFFFYQMGNFSIKRSLELSYGSTGQMERRLSGRMMVFSAMSIFSTTSPGSRSENERRLLAEPALPPSGLVAQLAKSFASSGEFVGNWRAQRWG
jgi:hypothetical protein